MNEIHGRAYYERRAAQERKLADSAADHGIAKIHIEMAQRYEELAVETKRAELGIVNPN